MITFLKKTISAALALVFLAGPCLAQQGPVSRPIETIKMDGGFRIGPYPVPFQHEGVNTVFWTWLYLTPVIEGRGNSTYKLYLTIKVQLDNIPEFARVIAEKKLSRDNCGRINAVDNWVYSVNRPSLELRNANNLRIVLNGHVSTWSCLENPVPETVCDTYRDSLGLTWPYNCRFRASTPIKWMNFQVGVIATEDIFLSAKDGEIQYKVNQPLFNVDNSGFLNPILNLLLDVFYNFGTAASNLVLAPTRIPLSISQDFNKFNPRYENARFETTSGAHHVSITASAGITRDQINSFMRNAVGPLWNDIGPAVGIAPTPGPMTKSRLREECRQILPGVDIRECAAKSGWPYDALPD